MPTGREKHAEKERVTRISGFRVGYHDFLAAVDLEALKRRNDRWEAEHRHQVFGTDHGALPGKRLCHQQRVDFRVPVGAAVFHHDEVTVEGGEAHRGQDHAAGALQVVSIPFLTSAVALGHMTDSSNAQTADDAMQQECRKRRRPSPLDLSRGADVPGSTFFPLLPQPKTLAMKYHTSKGEAELQLPLEPLGTLPADTPKRQSLYTARDNEQNSIEPPVS